MRDLQHAGADVFLDEYSQNDVIAKYLAQTAGAGIAHVLSHVYAPVYLTVVKALIAQRPRSHSFRLLEYGCGGAMNLFKLLELFEQQGAHIDIAVGADFSPPMIEAARAEASRHLPPRLHQQVRLVVANNETLADDVASGLGHGAEELERTFDLIVGVNTFRYCHRLNKSVECAQDLFRLLSPGGYSIMIDMNSRFPLFRSRLAGLLSRRSSEPECYVPNLREYTEPFERTGFRIIETRNFCWIPHSARPLLVALCRAMAPLLELTCPSRAMRSLVIAQRPV
jgi:SAM-dependent methyltransferase